MTKKEGDKLTPKQQKALVALLTNSTKEAAAKAAGIESKTLRRYLSNPDFQAEYRRAFASMVEDATRQAQQTLSPALSVLREIMEDGDIPAAARVSAAKTALEYALRLAEVSDLAARLEALENAAKGVAQ